MNLKNLLTNLFKKDVKPEKPEKPKSEKAEKAEKAEIAPRDNSKRTWKFSEEEKMEIIVMIAQGMSPTEIVHETQERFGKSVSKTELIQYKQTDKWRPIIQKLKADFMANLSETAISHKRVRLERVEKVYDKAIEMGQLKLGLSSLEHARKEMEEKQSGVTNIQVNQYSGLTSEELQARKAQILERMAKKQVIDVSKEN